MSLWTLIDWGFYGLVRYIMVWIPFVTPFHVGKSLPSQWWKYNSYGDWLHKDDNKGGPDEHWCRAWLKMVAGEFESRFIDKAKDVIGDIKGYLLGKLGYIKSGHSSMGSWVGWLNGLVGSALPGWAYSVTWGLGWLRDRLPTAIQQGWKSWDSLFESIKTSVKNWVMAVYDAFKSKALDAWSWVVYSGGMLVSWYNAVKGWIDHFRSNPYGYIAGLLGWGWSWLLAFAAAPVGFVLAWLGNDWKVLQSFAQGPLGFYYNLWSNWADLLCEFVNDPVAFIYARLERALSDRW